MQSKSQSKPHKEINANSYDKRCTETKMDYNPSRTSPTATQHVGSLQPAPAPTHTPPPFPGKQCTCSILLLASLTLCCAELLLRCPSPARICCSRSCTIILDLYGAQSVHVHIYRKLISHSQSRSQTLHYDALVF